MSDVWWWSFVRATCASIVLTFMWLCRRICMRMVFFFFLSSSFSSVVCFDAANGVSIKKTHTRAHVYTKFTCYKLFAQHHANEHALQHQWFQLGFSLSPKSSSQITYFCFLIHFICIWRYKIYAYVCLYVWIKKRNELESIENMEK